MSGAAAWSSRVPPLETPAVVVDVDALDENLAAMAGSARRRSIALRPHAKTHKCRAVARRQLDHGAVGLTVATLGEAEYFADDGVDDIFVAYPLWPDGGHRRRLAALAERVRLGVGVDSVEAVAALGDGGGAVEVLIEVDSGHGRSGVPPGRAAEIALAAARGGLRVGGVFTFPGHSYDPGAAPNVAAQEVAALARARRGLQAAGLEGIRRSGGSTPTASLTPGGEVDELRPGVYAFNDAQQVRLGTCRPSEVALAVVATVVSAPAPDRVVLDAGSKVLGSDRPPWMPSYGTVPHWPGTSLQWLSEHHGVVGPDEHLPGRLPPLGAQVLVVPNHVCVVVNLAERLVVLRHGVVEDYWEVAPKTTNR